jgi:hypothetical protein
MSNQVLLGTIGVVATGIGFVGNAEAAVINFDTTGSNTFTDAGFYGVEFAEGPNNKFISTIVYDLAGTGTFFDFNDPVSSSFQGADKPVFDSLVGLTDADIFSNFLNPIGGDPLRPERLEFDFLPGSFRAGDSFRFAADTDGPLISGGAFGISAVPVLVVLSDGQLGSAVFSQVSPTQSTATVDIPHVPVPEPMTILAPLAVLGVGAFTKRIA